MRKIFNLLVALLAFHQVFAQSHLVSASMDKVKLDFMLDSGKPVYRVYFNGKPVIRKSAMGFKLADNSFFEGDFTISSTEIKTVDSTWSPLWGEVSHIRDHYRQLTVHLTKEKPYRAMNIIFRVFSDGVGFKYEFPEQANLKYFIVTDELTQFSLAGNHKAFWIPGDYDTNEYPYTTSTISAIDNRKTVKGATDIAIHAAPDPQGVQTPLMMKTSDGLYINIHEAGLTDFPAMQLHADRSNYQLTASLVPDAIGNKAYVHTPFSSPWRTVIITDNAPAILSSHLILNLNEPSKITNTEWIKPMKFIGVWWEMQTGKSTWSYADSSTAHGPLKPNGRHGANTANVKAYIDFAAENGISGVLVEGWNTGWEDWFGNWKEDVYSFIKPYPDFDLQALTAYSRSKGVQIIMHHETAGSVTDYERQMDTAYKFMATHGYNAVKTGYVGRIIPRGEYHDGQWMVRHYLRVAQMTAEHHIMLDVHEPVRPTGLHRTYPNWMASEAGRGNEYHAFGQGNKPDHETVLPFTRLMGGPMDYTPGIFKLKGYTTEANRQVSTTLAKQLALYITIYSPLQMVADQPENYMHYKDAFQFIKDVAVDWDDTRVLEAEPGEYISIARKEKGKDNWYIGAITNENGRSSIIPLTFLDKGRKYSATIYADAADADWKLNPEAYQITTIKVNSRTKLPIKLANGGGAAIRIIPE